MCKHGRMQPDGKHVRGKLGHFMVMLVRIVVVLVQGISLSGWGRHRLAVGGAQSTGQQIAAVLACPALRLQN